MDPNKDIVCQLCGAWFETRKGLSSHARAHLRHFGVEYSESKGSPIDLLAQLVSTDDFKHKVSEMQADGRPQLQQLQQQQSSPSLLNLSKASRSSPSSLLYKVTSAASKATSATASSPFGPPPKRHKSSSMRVFRLSSGELMALHSEFFFLPLTAAVVPRTDRFNVNVMTILSGTGMKTVYSFETLLAASSLHRYKVGTSQG